MVLDDESENGDPEAKRRRRAGPPDRAGVAGRAAAPRSSYCTSAQPYIALIVAVERTAMPGDAGQLLPMPRPAVTTASAQVPEPHHPGGSRKWHPLHGTTHRPSLFPQPDCACAGELNTSAATYMPQNWPHTVETAAALQLMDDKFRLDGWNCDGAAILMYQRAASSRSTAQ